MPEPIRYDFRKIIADLEAAGITIHKIALMCRRRFGTVQHWKKTGRLEHYDGQKLVIMHAEFCPATPLPELEIPKS